MHESRRLPGFCEDFKVPRNYLRDSGLQGIPMLAAEPSWHLEARDGPSPTMELVKSPKGIKGCLPNPLIHITGREGVSSRGTIEGCYPASAV